MPRGAELDGRSTGVDPSDGAEPPSPGRSIRVMLVLSGEEVRELLDVDALIDALADAMADLSVGRASVPDRIAALVPERDGLLAAMPGYVPSLGALASKLVSLFPRNAGSAIPTHQAVIAVFDPETGSPVAMLDGHRDHRGPDRGLFWAVCQIARP